MKPADWAQLNWKQRAVHPHTLKALAGGSVVGFALVAGYWNFSIKPQEALNRKRFEAGIAVARLYGLQLAHMKAKGTYSGDLDALLALAPDGPALKASLAANADMTTIAVVGDAKKFKIEINVLDGRRTPIKIRGPVVPRAAVAPRAMPEAAPPLNADGSPLAPGR